MIPSLNASVSFGSRDSTFKINAGSDFHVGSSNLNIAGTLKLETGSIVTGNPIRFSDGLLSVNNVEAAGDSVFEPYGIITRDLKMFTRSGLSVHDLYFSDGADVVLTGSVQLLGDWVFTGNGTISGNGCVLDLSSGNLVVNNDSTLFLNDIHITGLGDSVGKIILRNVGSQVHIANSSFKLDDNLTTSNGTFYVYGPTTFQLGPLNWTFDTGTGNLVVDGTSLWLDCLNSPLLRGKVYAPLAVPTTEANLEADLASGHLSLINRGTIKELVDASFTFSGGSYNNPDEIIFDGNVSGTISLQKCVCVGKNQTIKITGNTTIDGNGVCIYFSTDPRAQLTIMPDTILTLSNVCFCHMHQDVLDMRDGSRIKIENNVHWGMIEDMTFSANAHIEVLDTYLGSNVFTLCGESGRTMFNIRPSLPVYEDQHSYARPNQTFILGHNTLQLDSAGISGLDYIYFYNDVDVAGAIALSGNSSADVDSNYWAHQVYREDDPHTQPFIDIVGQNDYGTAMNFVVEGVNNDFVLRKDGLVLGGNIAFGFEVSNELHVHFNAPELYDPSITSNEERAKARAAYEAMVDAKPNENFPFVILSGDPGIYVYSIDGLAYLDFFDHSCAVVNETTNAFAVDDNSMLTYNRLWLLYNPVKQYSRIFRASGFELMGEGIDPSFIRMPRRALANNVLPTAIYKRRLQEKERLALEKDSVASKIRKEKHNQYFAASQKNKKSKSKKSTHRGIELGDEELRTIVPVVQPIRAIHPPIGQFGRVKYDQPVWTEVQGHDLKTSSGLSPMSGSIGAQDTTISNFNVSAGTTFNLSLLGNSTIQLGADTTLVSGSHIINITGTGNVIELGTYALVISPDTLYLDTGAEVTFVFPDDGAKSLTINSAIDIEDRATVKVSGPGTLYLANRVVLNFKMVSTTIRPTLVLTNRATMSVLEDSYARILGIGSVIIEQGAGIVLGATSGQLITGQDTAFNDGIPGHALSIDLNDIQYRFTNGGRLVLGQEVASDGVRTPNFAARFSVLYATSSIRFDNGATLYVGPSGVFEVNCINNGSTITAARGNLTEFAINHSALFVIGSGIFALGENQGVTPTTFSYDGLNADINWYSNEGPGLVRYVSYDSRYPTVTGRITTGSDEVFSTIPAMTSKQLIRALMNQDPTDLTTCTLLVDAYANEKVWTAAGYLSSVLRTNDVIDGQTTQSDGSIYVNGHNSQTGIAFTINPYGVHKDIK
jgi:hypothetical protein